MGEGLQRIDDEAELATVRRQARRVLFKSVLAAGAVMIVLLLLLV